MLRPGEGTELGSALNSVVTRCFDKGVASDAAKIFDQEDEAQDEKLFTEQDGQVFPAVRWNDDLVPEAWSYRQAVLPHQLGTIMRATFPKAKAASGPGVRDYEPEVCELERRGHEDVYGLAR